MLADPWCHGPPCDHAGARWPQHLLPDPYWAGWMFRRMPEGGLLCPGCRARENPHATGPHTRIVEEWEHEYGALCRVVVGPLIYPLDGLGARVDEYVLERWERMGPDAAGVVPGLSRHIHASNPDTVSTHPSVSLASSLRDAVARAHADAERLALEWSPPVDEEAA